MAAPEDELPDGWEVVTRRDFIGRWAMQCSASDRYIVVAGGVTGNDPNTRENIYSKSVNVYDIKENNWITLPDARRLFCFAVFVEGDYVYHTIGQHKELYRINISAPEAGWERMADMTHARASSGGCFPTGAEKGRHFYIAGGYRGEKLRSAERYNPIEDKWEELPNLFEGRHDHAAAVFQNKMYLFGGSGEGWGDPCVPSSRMYDMSSMTWVELPDLPFGMSSHSATSVGKWILLTGGISWTDDNIYEPKGHQSIYLFNTETRQWHNSTTQLPYPLSQHGSCVILNGTNGPRVAVIGGRKGDRSHSDAIIAIDFVRLLLKPDEHQQFSLLQACKIGLSWTEGVKEVVMAQPASVTNRDPETGLLPFMLTPDVETCFEILRCTVGRVGSLQEGGMEEEGSLQEGGMEEEGGQETPANKKAKIV